MPKEFLWIVIAIVIGFFLYLIFRNRKNSSQSNDTEIIKIQDKFQLETVKYEQKIAQLQQQMIEQKKEFEVGLQKEIKEAQKRSNTAQRSIVKGQMAEKFVPFMQGFDYNPEDCEFLGKPIDYIIFNNLSKCEEGEVNIEEVSIVLLEVKTGSAKLNKRQEILKQVIERGQIHFSTVRVNEDELKIQNEPSLSASMKSTILQPVIITQSSSETLNDLEEDRVGEKWTVEEEYRLVKAFNNGHSITEIAQIHKRKEGGIRSRLRKLGKIE